MFARFLLERRPKTVLALSTSTDWQVPLFARPLSQAAIDNMHSAELYGRTPEPQTEIFVLHRCLRIDAP